DKEPFLPVPNCPLKGLFEWQLAEFAMQLQPRRYAAGNGDGIPAARRHRFLAAEELGRPAGRGATGGIEAVQLPAVPDDGVGVGADAVGHRLDQREGDGGGEGGVDRSAAGGEHLQPGLRGKRLRGGHGIFGEHRPARPGVGIVPGKGRHRGAVVTDPKSSTTRPSTFPPFRSSSARLAWSAARVSTGIGFSFPFFASATTSFSSRRLPMYEPTMPMARCAIGGSGWASSPPYRPTST